MTIWMKALYFAPPLLAAVILHEVAHGWIAEKLGDKTARQMGRITLNPLVHIDPLMTIIVPALLISAGSPFIFGGAKPVPVNPLNFENPRRGMAYVAIAGPITNFLIMGVCWLIFHELTLHVPTTQPNFTLMLIEVWLQQSIFINLVLGLFNLLPIPPLDGGRIAVGFLPLSIARQWARLERYGLFIVIALMMTGKVADVIGPVIDYVATLVYR